MQPRKRAVPDSPKRGDSVEGEENKFPYSLFSAMHHRLGSTCGRLHWWNHDHLRFVFFPASVGGYFLAAKIRYIVGKRKWIVLQVVWLRSRWRAKDQAWKWYCKVRKKPFQSLHRVTDARKARGQQLQKEMQQRKEADEQDALFAQIQKGTTYDRGPENTSGGAGGSGSPDLSRFFA